MARYLTPLKIGLLALTTIYAESRITNSATIPVLSFLVDSIVRKNTTGNVASAQVLLPSIEDFQNLLIVHNSAVPGRSVWDLFVQQLWSISDFNLLHLFFDFLPDLLEKSRDELLNEDPNNVSKGSELTKLSRNSPLGIFVRRSHLEFTKLPLHDGIRLWKDFVAFRESTYIMWKKKYPRSTSGPPLTSHSLSAGESLNSVLYGDLVHDANDWSIASSDDIEQILGVQVEQMQKTGQRVSLSIQNELRTMLSVGTSTSNLVHYGAFLDAWRAADYTSSFDSLHRYFDYTMHASGKNFYHYALLNMAFLHADFGCFSDAIAAIKESIAMARENKDMACLNYSLSWLYNLGKMHPEELDEIQQTGVLGTDREALSFIKTKAKDSESWSLLSTCLLAETKYMLINGESIASAFENLARCMYLNHLKSVDVSIGQQMMTESSFYARVGLNHMEWLRGDLFLEIYAGEALAQDRLEFVCRSAMRLARAGKYDEAVMLMRDLDAGVLRVPKLNQAWNNTRMLLEMRRALHKDEFSAIRHYLSQLNTNSTSQSSVFLEAKLYAVEFEMRKGDFPAALEGLELVAGLMNTENGDLHDQLLLMVWRAHIYDKAGVPQKAFSVALRAASVSYKSRILDVLFRSVGAISRILLSVREFEAASNLMISIMPQILECEDCELAATSFLSLADAEMGMAGTEVSGSVTRKEHVTKALGYLERSFDEFSSIEDARGQSETMAKRAMIMRVTRDTILSNDYASKYVDIKRAKVANVQD